MGGSVPYDIFSVPSQVVCDQVVENIHETEISSRDAVVKNVI